MNYAGMKPNALNIDMNTRRWKSRLMTSRSLFSRTTFCLEYWVQTIC